MPGITLSELLKKMIEMGGSDLHLTTNSAAAVRVHWPLASPGHPAADGSGHEIAGVQRADGCAEASVRRKYGAGLFVRLKNLARFRGNVFNQRGAWGAVFRTHSMGDIKGFDQLGLLWWSQGLLRQAARTGAGDRADGFRQSTTLAAMLDRYTPNAKST